ncbi:dehydrogenase [Nocardioides sp. Root122]|uniref:molybdopterin-dependent oxidoreductase n=1 Tax=Nocardioides TaxID=1839 RepID=UPI0007031169|nr:MULTISPECIES: molybdopterin-dependent oxidoreductase [Nocardioides]KQV72812.1 dehydrogenase [Nocardioides sp. Root122]MCK9825973.1 molybdopterin-dependent oxidoreductase [Nocardioides cavernae]
MSETRIGVCNLCEAICGLELTVEGRDVLSVRGNRADPLSRGHICPKGVAIADVYVDPDRLRRPVRRLGEGADATWQEIGWDEAFDLVADNLARVIEQHGDDALGVYLGNPNAHSLGSMTHGTAMFKSFRTKNRYSATSVDQLPHQLVAHLMFGHQLFLPIPDIDRTSWFLVIGANPMASNGSLMTVPDFPQRVRDLKARGGRMVVLDPRRTETAKVADEHHFVRPGTDAWVLLAMLHELTTRSTPTVASYVDGLDTVVELVAGFTPERAEEMSGLPAEEIRRLAGELVTADGGVVYSRIGVSAGPWGTVCQWAVNCLNILSGNLDRVGGALFTTPAIDAVGTGLIGRGHFDAWRSRVRGLPETAGELPVSALREEIETPGEGQVRALLTVAGNPVLSTPDGARLDTALRDLDFMAAVDIYVNETTRHADVILPPTTALERDHYDLVFHLLAVRNTARFTPAVFDKEADQRHDWQIFREITLRTAARLSRKVPLKKRLVQRARLTASPTFLIGQLLRRGDSGVTLSKLRARPAGIDLGPLRARQLPDRLPSKNKRIDLAPAVVVEDVARLAAVPRPVGDELLLIGRRHKQDCNSWMHNSERLTRGRPRHQLLMNPEDLDARAITDGARVRVTSRVGTVEVEVAASADLMPGVVSLPHGYGHAKDGVLMSRSRDVPGVSINDLTDPELLDVSGNAALNGVPVSVSAC